MIYREKGINSPRDSSEHSNSRCGRSHHGLPIMTVMAVQPDTAPGCILRFDVRPLCLRYRIFLDQFYRLFNRYDLDYNLFSFDDYPSGTHAVRSDLFYMDVLELFDTVSIFIILPEYN
jgi:hypothetical protein